MSPQPNAATDGHRCVSDDCTDDEPVVIGRWLRFLNYDHNGMSWVPIANITRIDSNDEWLDVHHLPPSDDPEQPSEDCTMTWDRIRCGAPWAVAAAIAGAPQ